MRQGDGTGHRGGGGAAARWLRDLDALVRKGLRRLRWIAWLLM